MVLARELGEEVVSCPLVHLGCPWHCRGRRRWQAQAWSEGVRLSAGAPLGMGPRHCEDLLEKQEGMSCPAGGEEGRPGSHAEVAVELGSLFLCCVSSFTAAVRQQVGWSDGSATSVMPADVGELVF